MYNFVLFLSFSLIDQVCFGKILFVYSLQFNFKTNFAVLLGHPALKVTHIFYFLFQYGQSRIDNESSLYFNSP